MRNHIRFMVYGVGAAVVVIVSIFGVFGPVTAFAAKLLEYSSNPAELISYLGHIWSKLAIAFLVIGVGQLSFSLIIGTKPDGSEKWSAMMVWAMAMVWEITWTLLKISTLINIVRYAK